MCAAKLFWEEKVHSWVNSKLSSNRFHLPTEHFDIANSVRLIGFRKMVITHRFDKVFHFFELNLLNTEHSSGAILCRSVFSLSYPLFQSSVYYYHRIWNRMKENRSTINLCLRKKCDKNGYNLNDRIEIHWIELVAPKHISARFFLRMFFIRLWSGFGDLVPLLSFSYHFKCIINCFLNNFLSLFSYNFTLFLIQFRFLFCLCLNLERSCYCCAAMHCDTVFFPLVFFAPVRH